MDTEKLTKAVIEVVLSNKKYETYYSFAKRLPYLEDTRCMTLRQWMEVRLNFEIYDNIPELSEYVEKFNGELFEVIAVYDLNEDKRSFSEVEVSLVNSPNSYIGDENYLDEIENVKAIIGSDKFKFDNNKKKTKVTLL